MFTHFFGISKTKLRRLLQGGFLGLGAPAGWLLLCRFWGLMPDSQYYEDWLFLYMAVGTVGVFSVFGFIIGKHEQRFAELSLIDPLTKLFNPRYFHTRFRQELSRSVRQGQSLVLLVADIDFFKKVNDRYGHQIGDVVLVAVAQQLLASVRDSDTVARVGGEEFAVLLPATDMEGGRAFAERMRVSIQDTPVRLDDGRHISVTVSFGVSVHSGSMASPEQLYNAADKALYQAKNSGRNRVIVADEIY